MQRSRHLDGLRALAIGWVALYHYAWFWAPIGKGDPLLPYGDALAAIPFASIGYLGVYLFFIVSGIVITLSLDRAASLPAFALARFLRLWPTLVICAALTFAATSVFGPVPLIRDWPEALISLSFIPPAHIGKLTGNTDWQWLDGAYWSLWTEVRFYIIAGVLFFAMRSHFLAGWIMFSAFSALIHILGLSGVGAADALSRLIFAEYHPYFSAGIALAYIAKRDQRKTAAILLLASWGLAIGYTPVPAQQTLIGGICLVFALPILVVLRPHWVGPLAWKPVATIGQASYAYYLLHQNFGLALLSAWPIASIPAVAAMVLIQGALIILSVLILWRVELPLARWIKSRRSDATRPA